MPTESSARPGSRAPGAVAWSALALGLVITLLLFLESRGETEARAARRMERAVAHTRNVLEMRADGNEDLLRATAGFFSGNTLVTESEFRTYYEELDLAKRDASVYSLAFIAPVRREDLPQYLERRRSEGPELKAVKTSGDREDLFLIQYYEPLRPGSPALGLDTGAVPENRRALEEARDLATMRVAAPIYPIDRSVGPALAFQYPVYRRIGSLSSAADRRRALQGWVSLLVLVRPFVGDVLRGQEAEVAVELYEGARPGPASLLFSSVGTEGPRPEGGARQVTSPIVLGAHPFTLVFTALPGFATAPGNSRPLGTLLAGLLVSGLLFGVVWSLSSTRARALSLAEEMTASLRASEGRYQILFEQSLAGIFRSTVDGRILECNDAFARLFGYPSRREIIESSATALYEEPADRDAFLAELRAKGTILDREARYRRRDGTTVWTLEAATLKAGDPPVIEGTVIDVSDRRRALDALRESEERYRGVFQHFQDGVFVVDFETKRVLDSNPSLQRTLGYTAAEMLALGLYEICADDHASVDAAVAQAVDAKSAHVGERRYRRKDGSAVAMEIDAFLLEENGRPVLLVVARNIAERQFLEAQLRQAQKMEAVGRLAGGVAHDFNNLLTAILGYSDLILTGDAPEDVRQNVEEVRKAAERAAALTGQLLAFSRKQVQQPRVLELNDVVKNLDGMLHRVLRENVKIAFEPDPDLWRVKADPGQLEQVLMNLAVNASDAMPEGGRLAIRTQNVTLKAGEVPGIPVEAGSYVLLEVSDTGQGMDAETLAHAFEPFFTTKERGKGTGLGLAMVYGIVKQSSGYVQALSEPGKGATFRIYLPRIHGPADAMSSVSLRPVQARGSETILLVEDEESVRRLAQTVLRSRGYQVLVAETAEAALELSRAHPERIQLLLTDVVLPGMDGHRLAEILRVERPDLAVLLSSGYFDTSEGVDRSEQLLRKPFTPDALFEKVRATLRKARRPAT